MHCPERSLQIVPTTVVAGLGTFTSDPIPLPPGVSILSIQSAFVYAAGGGTCKVYIQTSLDEGATWIDIACFAYAVATATRVSAVRRSIALAAAVTPGDGTLADNSILDGLLGDRVRAKWIVAAVAYSGATSLNVAAVVN